MPRYRRDINKSMERDIKRTMDKGKSIEDTALKYDISYTLARQIKYGKRIRPPALDTTQAQTEEKDLCTCCHTRAKAPGNHYLCTVCHSNN